MRAVGPGFLALLKGAERLASTAADRQRVERCRQRWKVDALRGYPPLERVEGVAPESA